MCRCSSKPATCEAVSGISIRSIASIAPKRNNPERRALRLAMKLSTYGPRGGARKFVFVATIAIAVIASSIGLWYFKTARDARGAHQAAPAAIPVTAGQAASQDVPIFVRALGTVQALMSVAVRARVDGQIT